LVRHRHLRAGTLLDLAANATRGGGEGESGTRGRELPRPTVLLPPPTSTQYHEQAIAVTKIGLSFAKEILRYQALKQLLTQTTTLHRFPIQSPICQTVSKHLLTMLAPARSDRRKAWCARRARCYCCESRRSAATASRGNGATRG
jgi:hypothetical protein